MILLRSALFNLYFFATTALLSVASIALRLFAPRHMLVIPMIWARWVLAGLRVICGIRFEVLGAERLPSGGAALIASRHQSAFDTVVRDKNAELLARLKGELMEVNTCEATYYGNTDWYDRFGYMYFQFMSAHYGYAVSH